MLLETEFVKASSYRADFEELEIDLGHVPAYDEEQESEIGMLKTE